MKKDFFDYLVKIMADNKDIVFVSAGLGWPRTDEIRDKYPDQYVQTEAAEQTALDICVGLAYAGKIPIVYTITPFYLRAFETIRTYINHENLHVIMIGAGRDDDYSKHDGFSHDAGDIYYWMDGFSSVGRCYPDSVMEMQGNIDAALKSKNPYFISIPK